MLDVVEPNVRSRLPQDVRRDQLIEAAIGAIAEHGLSQVTLAKVASRAGLTAGMVNFHFDSKQALLRATLETLAEAYADACEAAIAAAGRDAEAGLMGLVRVNFDPLIASLDKLSVWTAFWGESRARADYMEICGASDQAFYEAVRIFFAELAAGEGEVDARAAGLAFCGLMDALWQEMLVQGEAFDRNEAIETCRRFLATIFRGRFGPSASVEPVAVAAAHPVEADGLVPTLPAWTYCDADFTKSEIERIHLPAWHVVCHVSEIAKAGDYVTIDVLGRRGFVLRGEDGEVRAFENVCRHRAHEVVGGRTGTCERRIMCPYHAWTYDLAGELKGIAASKTFPPSIDRSTLGLFKLDCELFMGFVFLRFVTGGPAVAERYSPHAQELSYYRIAEMEPISEAWQGEIEGDWKNVWDNYLEDYHFPTGHPGLSGLMSKAYDRQPDEATRTIRLSHTLRDSPGELSWSPAGYRKLLPDYEHLPAEQKHRWSYFYGYPGFAIEAYPDLVDYFHVVPIAPGRAGVRWRAFGLPGASRQTKAARFLNLRTNLQVHDEDTALVESVQKGLAGGSYTVGILGEMERNVRAFQGWVRADMPEAARKTK